MSKSCRVAVVGATGIAGQQFVVTLQKHHHLRSNTIACHGEEIVHDLPDGWPRYVSRARGIRWTFVDGRSLICDGRLPEPDAVSGAGRVIRAA